MSSTQPQNAGAYLYCVTWTQQLQANPGVLPMRGIAGQPVRAIQSGDLAAIVSDSPFAEYDVTHENVTAHEAVVEAVMEHADVLPFSFGTVANSDQEVQEFLRRESDELHQQLEHVRGRVELGVKAIWQQEQLFADVVASDPNIQALRDQIVGTTPEETYDIRLQIGELVDAAIQDRREQEAAAILNALAPYAVEMVANNIISDMMIVNAAFLVERSRVQEFAAQVESLRQAYQGRGIFQFAGPLPPYNFVSISVHWEELSNATAQ